VTDPLHDLDAPGMIAPPPLLFAVPIALGVLLQWLIPIPRPAAELAHAAIIVGTALIVVAIALILSANRVFRRAGTSVLPTRPSTALVTHGPFRFTRNPMYLGLTLVGSGVALLAWAAMAPSPDGVPARASSLLWLALAVVVVVVLQLVPQLGLVGLSAKPLKLAGAEPPLREFSFHHPEPQKVADAPIPLFRSPTTKEPPPGTKGKTAEVSPASPQPAPAVLLLPSPL